MLYWPNIIRVPLVLVLFLVVAGASSEALLADADEDNIARIKGWTVSVSPASFSYEDEITIAMSGLPKNFPFDTTSVSLGGSKVYVHTDGEGHDARPLSDGDGNLQVKASIIDWSSSKSQYLKVDIPNIFVAKTPVDFKPLNLRVSSTEVVPYQEVWVVGIGFTKPSRSKGWRSVRINENISGTGSLASVTIGGEPVLPPHIGFPVEMGRDGAVFFKMVVPESQLTITPGQVELRIIDSEGREGVATLTVAGVNLGLGNYISYPGENVPFALTGMPAHREGLNNDVELTYGYSLDLSGKKYASVSVGSFVVNEIGSVSGRFNIPKNALLTSSNRIWVTGASGKTWEFTHLLADRSITPSPAAGYQGDPVSISIKGMPPSSFLSSGSISIGGYQVKVPGYFGETGDKPVSNDFGSLIFDSVVPKGLLPGYHSIVWNAPGGKTATTTFHVETNRLQFDPPWAVPGQVLTMNSGSHSVKMRGVRISGSGDSYVSIDGERMLHDALDYPISISPDGKFETTIKVPIDKKILTQDRLTFTTVDTAGRIASGTLYLRRESVTVTPVESVRGTNIIVEGAGFFANAKNESSSYRVLISYGGAQIGSALLDDAGEFSKSLIVPDHAVVGAKNEISVALEDWPSVKGDSNHTVPGAMTLVIPDVASAGDRIMVTGTGYIRFRQVTVGIGHLWATAIGTKVHTDEIGNFEIFVDVPQSLDKGLVSLSVYAPYPNQVATVPFQVR